MCGTILGNFCRMEFVQSTIEIEVSRFNSRDVQLKNLTLYEIEKILLQNNSSLKNFDGMPYPDKKYVYSSNNLFITEELAFDRDTLKNELDQLLHSLTDEQRGVYEDIMKAVQFKKGGVFFVYGYGGTGKTFLWKTLSTVLRCKGQIVLNVALSGIASLLLPGGEGKVGGANDGETTIDIPNDILINDPVDPIGTLIQFVYPSILENSKIPTYFQERAILAPKNEVVHKINDRLLGKFPGVENEYLSSDSLCHSDYLHDNFDKNLHSPDVLNGLTPSGLPLHKLVLKVGVPVMLLRNIDQKCGLCNGTRLRVIALGNRVIEAEILSGNNVGNRTFIPRITLTPSDKRIAFAFQRRQFPLVVCFAMTINKSQGQSLSKVGLFLKEHVFTHGQLYVALSRVKSKDGLKILSLSKDGQITNTTFNVVFKEIFGFL
ncbi:hypothetical protein LXL04_016922 [Taraxacum kok-saghyz]